MLRRASRKWWNSDAALHHAARTGVKPVVQWLAVEPDSTSARLSSLPDGSVEM